MVDFVGAAPDEVAMPPSVHLDNPTVASPEYDILVDPADLPEDAKQSLGLHIDDATLIIYKIDADGMASLAMERAREVLAKEIEAAFDEENFEKLDDLKGRTLEAPIEVGDQLVSVDSGNAADIGRKQLLKFARTKLENQIQIRLRRASERKRLAAEREDKDVLVEDGVIIVDEGEDVEGISEHPFVGQIIMAMDPGMKGYGRISSSPELAATIGFNEVPAPSYMILSSGFAAGARVAFNVTFNFDGRPRARNLTEAPQPPKPPPKIDVKKPFPDDTSWSFALSKDEALRRRDHQGKSAATLGGKRPALAQRNSAEIGDELTSLRLGEAATVRPVDVEVLSDVESEESTDSISGGIERPWAEGRVDARTMYARDKAVGFSQEWQPMQWTEGEWEHKLGQAGELAPKPPPRPVSPLVRFRKAVLKVQAAIKLRNLAGGAIDETLFDDAVHLDDESEDQQARLQRWSVVLEEVARKLEADFGGPQAEGALGARLALDSPRAALALGGFGNASVAARDAQTHAVTKLLRQGMSERDVVDLFRSSLEGNPTLAPPRRPELRPAEIYEAKALLESISFKVQERQQQLNGCRPRPGPQRHSQGWVDNAAVQQNLAFYACRPTLPQRAPPDPARFLPRATKSWL